MGYIENHNSGVLVPAVKSKCVINCSDKDAETVVKTLQQADDDIDVFRKLIPPNVVYDVL